MLQQHCSLDTKDPAGQVTYHPHPGDFVELTRAPLSANRRIGRTVRQGSCVPAAANCIAMRRDAHVTRSPCEIKAFDQLSESAKLIDSGRRSCRLCASAVEPSGDRTCRTWFFNDKQRFLFGARDKKEGEEDTSLRIEREFERRNA
jgi:hypothetical protein